MKVICTLIFVLLIDICRTDQCIFNTTNNELPSGWSFATIEQVRQCFGQIRLDERIKNETMLQLFHALDFYSFLSIAQQSGEPYFLNVNLRNELTKIQKENFTNDYDFHLSIVNSFKKLNDFHTAYIAPQGYARFELLLPFILKFLPKTKQVQIQFAPRMYSSVTGIDLRSYVGRIVTKIDGIDPMTYFRNFAQNFSLMSKDSIVKINSIFRREFWLRNLANYPVPLSNNITFQIDTSTTITLPFIVIVTKQYNGQLQLESDNNVAQAITIDYDLVFKQISQQETLNWYEQSNSTSYQRVLARNRTFYYRHSSSQTAIIRLESFDEAIFDQAKEIFLAATGQNLILDLIGNHGGHSCFAYALLRYLIPEYHSLSNLYEPMDARITEALSTFSSVFSAFPNSIYDFRTNQSFTTLEWIDPWKNYTRGNITDPYSMKWSINCDGLAFGSGKFWIENQTSPFSSIYVLTDGTCGSACSLFLSKLKLSSRVQRVYGIGGGYDSSNGNLFESSSYAGGGAFSWNDIVTYYNQVAAPGSSSIGYLPTNAHLNLNVYELYITGINRDYPREFVTQPIDRRLDHADYVNLQTAFDQIIREMNSSSSVSCAKKSKTLLFVLLYVFMFLLMFT